MMGVIFAAWPLMPLREKVKGLSTDTPSRIMGLIMPHHELASEMMIRTVEKVTTATPGIEYVVVLSPNHFKPQSETFTLTKTLKDFAIASQIIDQIRDVGPKMIFDQQLLEGEHGLFVPMSFLRPGYPTAQFIPIAISPYFSTEKLQKMARALSEVLPEETLFVVSTDFSHGQMLEQAQAFDTQTVAAIQNFDLDRLLEFGDTNLDCPACVAVLLYIGQIREADSFEQWEESHGALITGNPLLNGTSYVTGGFKSKPR